VAHWRNGGNAFGKKHTDKGDILTWGKKKKPTEVLIYRTTIWLGGKGSRRKKPVATGEDRVKGKKKEELMKNFDLGCGRSGQ